MIVIQDKLLKEKYILNVYCTDDWNSEISKVMLQGSLTQLKETLEQIVQENFRVKLFIDCTKGKLPSIQQGLKIAMFMKGIEGIIQNAVDFTVLYATTPIQQSFMEQILKIYTPVRPIVIAKSVDELKNTLRNGPNN